MSSNDQQQKPLTSQMAQAVEYNARLLVDYPDQVRVNEFHSQACVVIELSVDSRDLGKIIGKQGKNADALRTIVFGIASKNKARVMLQIIQ